MSEWISVQDRLPERGLYLVAFKSQFGPFVMEADFYAERFHRLSGDCGPISGVTHWMPLPAAPAETGEPMSSDEQLARAEAREMVVCQDWDGTYMAPKLPDMDDLRAELTIMRETVQVLQKALTEQMEHTGCDPQGRSGASLLAR